jgi:hypothetical protein
MQSPAQPNLLLRFFTCCMWAHWSERGVSKPQNTFNGIKNDKRKKTGKNAACNLLLSILEI